MSMTDSHANYFESCLNFKGKTLKEIADGQYWFSQGVSVYVLQNEEDLTGKEIANELSVKSIIKQYPYLENCKVKYENDFYGIHVLRIMLPAPKEISIKDKVLDGLKHHLHPEDTTNDGETWTEHCFHCPYYEAKDCIRTLLSDCEKLLMEEH